MSTRIIVFRSLAAIMLFAGLVNIPSLNARANTQNKNITGANVGHLNNKLNTETVNQWTVWDTISGRKISMVSPTDGWMMGFTGKTCNLYHWDGNSWNASGSLTHPDYDIRGGAIEMVSSTDGWLAFWGDKLVDRTYYGPDTLLYRWDGDSWIYWGKYSDRAIRAMDHLSSTNIWAAVNTKFLTEFYQWDGYFWNYIQETGFDTSVSDDIEMITDHSGWAVGIGIAYWDGSSWTQLSDTPDLRAISAVSDSDIWAVGWGGVIRHKNGNWTEVASPVSTPLYSVAMVSNNVGWAVGGSGVILYWDGTSWSQISSPTTSNLYDIVMDSADSGWIVGDNVILRLTHPTLISNYSTGQPGSYFNVSGSNFGPNRAVEISVNGHILSSSISTDPSGAFIFTLNTQYADAGWYFLTARVDQSSTIKLTLTPSEPLHERVDDWTVIEIPSGIAWNNEIFLPFILR